MATTRYVSDTQMTRWPTTEAYQAAGITPVAICNPPHNSRAYFWIQAGGVAPTFPPSEGISLNPGEKFYVQLNDLERVWISAFPGQTVNVVE